GRLLLLGVAGQGVLVLRAGLAVLAAVADGRAERLTDRPTRHRGVERHHAAGPADGETAQVARCLRPDVDVLGRADVRPAGDESRRVVAQAADIDAAAQGHRAT